MSCPLSSVRSRVMASQAALLKQKEQPGPYLRPVITAFTNTGSTGVFMYKGVEISTSSTSAEAFHRQKE
ncbi:EZH inhibitory protein [Dissostichus eleginoides]|uniref:EZH inhibitory protein n=1 Tax=Dissostichus eleginoides TaxID=100907 RepID=A0AAD9F6V4_DISEL|nr:EZH inhibitory protein [Dissostichus eleginoides]